MAGEGFSLSPACYTRSAPSDATIFFSADRQYTVDAKDRLSEEEDSTTFSIPVGCTSLICVGRLCGDFYGALKSDRFHLAAIGGSPREVIAALISAAEAA